MTVASLELCKELYELSGWETDRVWSMRPESLEASLVDGMVIDGQSVDVPKVPTVCLRMGQSELAPAYDLGYLLRKLDQDEDFSLHRCHHQDGSRNWCAEYENAESETFNYFAYADTPEDAAAKLCLELLKQGILERAS